MAGSGFVRITFQIEGQKVINRKLATWAARIEDLSPAWEKVGDVLLDDFRRNFDAEGGMFGRWSRWPALQRSTIRDRIRRGYGAGPILERTGMLRQSVTERMTPGNVFIVEKNRLTVGTHVPYAKYHQWGTSRMPARPVVGLTRERAGWQKSGNSIVRIMNDYAREEARKAGLNVEGGL